MKKVILIIFLTLLPFFLSADQTIVLRTTSWPPYYGQELEDQGFYTEICREAFRRIGVKLDAGFLPFARAYSLAEMGEIDGLLGVFRSEERENIFDFSVPVAPYDNYFYILKANNSVKDGNLESIGDRVVIGAVRGSAIEAFLEEKGLYVESVSNQIQNIERFLAGRIDLLIGNPLILQLEKYEKYELNAKARMLKPPFFRGGFHVAINKESPFAPLIPDFNRALREMQEDGTVNKILLRHDINPYIYFRE